MWFQKMLMKYGGIFLLVRECFFLEKLHYLLRFCVHFTKKIANQALSEMMLLREELGKITFDVGRSLVEKYTCTLYPPPPE